MVPAAEGGLDCEATGCAAGCAVSLLPTPCIVLHRPARALSAADTSWQHKPMRLDRRTSHHHRHATASIASASVAAASEAGSQPTSPDYMAVAGGMAPATLLARTYSGPTVVAAITAASTGRKMQQRAALLQRISADAISVRLQCLVKEKVPICAVTLLQLLTETVYSATCALARRWPATSPCSASPACTTAAPPPPHLQQGCMATWRAGQTWRPCLPLPRLAACECSMVGLGAGRLGGGAVAGG